jgi:hypothetical protein
VGTVTFAGYWTGVYDQEKHIFRLDTFVTEETTINWTGDLIPSDQVAVAGTPTYYFGYSETTGGTDLLVTNDPLGFPVRMYSNDPNLVPKEKVTTQAANWPCLLAGTLVATPAGERRVEDLRPGDLVLTPRAEAVTIRWIGRRSAIAMFAGPGAVPVRIQAGALSDGIPAQDLFVSPDHAILIEGVLANAHALVNGSTIAPMTDPPERIDYYHLELDRHRLIVTNGTPVESFVDDVSRELFDNVDEWIALGVEPLAADPHPHLKVKSARQLPAAIAIRLADRAQSLASASA